MRSVRVAMVSGAVVCALGGALPAHAATRSVQRDQLEVVAGDADWVAYLVYPPHVGFDNYTNPVLEVRNRYAVTRSLGAISTVDDTDFDLVGSTLTADSPDYPGPDSVVWWNLTTHAEGTRKLGSTHDTYASAAPGGWVFDTDSTVYKEATTGHVRKLATLSPGAAAEGFNETACAGPHGVVVGPLGRSRWYYVRYHSGRATKLAGPQSTDDDTMSCNAASSRYATFSNEPEDGVTFVQKGWLATLDGRSDRVQKDSSKGCTIGGVVLDTAGETSYTAKGDGIVTAKHEGSCVYSTHRYVDPQFGGPTEGDPSITGGYGGVVLTTAGDGAIDFVEKATDQPKRLVTASIASTTSS